MQARANSGTFFYADENDYLARLPMPCRRQQQILVETTMMRSTRRSKRSQRTESLEEVSTITKPKKAQRLSTRVSVRNINNCVDFGIPDSLCCSSCQTYLDIDKRKRKSRCEYKSLPFRCSKPYEADADCHNKRCHATMFGLVS